MIEIPLKIDSEEQLNEVLSRPGKELIKFFLRLDGDLLLLGISGKIGPSLARMAKRAIEASGTNKRVIGVSRFSAGGDEEYAKYGIEIIKGDLLEPGFIGTLPLVKNVFFLAGMKFGSEEDLSRTWAMNAYLPAMVADHFKNSRIVAYSTGCVYPLVPVGSGGSVESDIPQPVGEYAMSCLGRERMFEYGSRKYGTEVALIRLNYAVELRYGVLVDIALKVFYNQPVDLSMGYFNVIWQGDANDFVLRSIGHCTSPANVLNITGKEILSVKEVAQQFGILMGKTPQFVNREESTALLNNPSRSYDLFGTPGVTTYRIMEWIAGWVEMDGRLLNKPTHFEVRNGKY